MREGKKIPVKNPPQQGPRVSARAYEFQQIFPSFSESSQVSATIRLCLAAPRASKRASYDQNIFSITKSLNAQEFQEL
jgi:hypothetical protein